MLAVAIAAGLDAASADLGQVILAQADTLPPPLLGGVVSGDGLERLAPSAAASLAIPRWLGFASPWIGVLALVALIATVLSTARLEGGSGHAHAGHAHAGHAHAGHAISLAPANPAPATETLAPTSEGDVDEPARGRATAAAFPARARARLDVAAAATIVTLAWGGPMPALGETPAAILAFGVVLVVGKSMVLLALARGLSQLVTAGRI
jgi:hypothetical protein